MNTLGKEQITGHLRTLLKINTEIAWNKAPTIHANIHFSV